MEALYRYMHVGALTKAHTKGVMAYNSVQATWTHVPRIVLFFRMWLIGKRVYEVAIARLKCKVMAGRETDSFLQTLLL